MIPMMSMISMMSMMKVWSTLNPPPMFRCAAALPVLFCLVIVVAAQGPFEPARFQSGSPPVYPPRAVGWGHEWLQVSLDSSGEVTGARLLRGASTFGLALQMAVRGWSFTPAREADEPIGSEVLVTAIFRPATLYDPPRLGQPVSGTVLVPAQLPIPVATPPPSHPPAARGSGVVIVEVEVDSNGVVSGTSVVGSSQGFDTVAVNTARRWRFEPARRQGRPVPSVAYLVFSFREPVVLPPIRP